MITIPAGVRVLRRKPGISAWRARLGGVAAAVWTRSFSDWSWSSARSGATSFKLLHGMRRPGVGLGERMAALPLAAITDGWFGCRRAVSALFSVSIIRVCRRENDSQAGARNRLRLMSRATRPCNRCQRIPRCCGHSLAAGVSAIGAIARNPCCRARRVVAERDARQNATSTCGICCKTAAQHSACARSGCQRPRSSPSRSRGSLASNELRREAPQSSAGRTRPVAPVVAAARAPPRIDRCCCPEHPLPVLSRARLSYGVDTASGST